MTSRVGKADRLRRAVQSKAVVRIKRSPRNADRVDGIVVAVGSRWALIAQTGDGGSSRVWSPSESRTW